MFYTTFHLLAFRRFEKSEFYKLGFFSWLESTADEGDRRTVVDRSTAPSRGRHRNRSGKEPSKKISKNQESGGEKGSSSLCPESNGTGSKCRSQPNDPGCVYMIRMSQGSGPHIPPPLYKVGFTDNLTQRKSNLKAGNPFTLKYFQIWPVCKKSDAEGKAKRKLRNDGLNYKENYNTEGGTEWYELPNPGGLQELERLVRCEIDEYIDENNAAQSRCTHPDVSSSDLVDSLTYPNHAPNQASAVMATNYDHLNPQSSGGYIEKWRQSLSKGNVLHVKYNCK